VTALAVHLPAAATIPVAVAVAVLIGWYWRALGAEGVPESRRRIRRASSAVMLTGLPILVIALSFADDRSAPTLYLVSWLLVLFAVSVVLVTVGIDCANTLRLELRRRRREMERAAAALGDAVRAARATSATGDNRRGGGR
jgi:hypothetical protein